jgi:hypothetical protein
LLVWFRSSQFRQNLVQLGRLERLGEIAVHAAVEAPFAVALHGVGGQGDNDAVPSVGLLSAAGFGRGFETVLAICGFGST